MKCQSFASSDACLTHLRHVLSQHELDYVATAMTPWHALGVMAALDNLGFATSGRGIIIIRAHPKDGFVVEPQAFRSISTATIVKDPATPPEQQGLLVAAAESARAFLPARRTKKRPLAIISPMQPNVRLLRLLSDAGIRSRYRPQPLLVDEGLATYFPSQLRQPIERVDRPMREGRLVGHLKRRGANMTRSFMRWRWQHRNFFLLESSAAGLRPAEEVLSCYRGRLAPDRERPSTPNGEVFVLSQPYSEYGAIQPNKEARLLVHLHQHIQSLGYLPRVKLHPRESPQKYEAAFRDAGICPQYLPLKESLEVLLRGMHPSAVLGYTSTALVTAPLFFDVPSFTAAEALARDADVEWLRETASTFAELTRSIVSPIHDLAPAEAAEGHGAPGS